MAFYRCMGGNGGGTTPTSITPSNSSPAAMSSGGVYQPTANGYAIESYQDKTPSDSTPPTVASGDIVKMGGAGYLYETQQTMYSLLSSSNVGNAGTGSQTQSFSATVGKHYLVIANRSATGTVQDCSISSGATVEEVYINNLQNTYTNAKVKLWVAKVVATATTVTMEGSQNCCAYIALD